MKQTERLNNQCMTRNPQNSLFIKSLCKSKKKTFSLIAILKPIIDLKPQKKLT